jgi:hypothetical protein
MRASVTAIVAVCIVTGPRGEAPKTAEHWVATWGTAPQISQETAAVVWRAGANFWHFLREE